MKKFPRLLVGIALATALAGCGAGLDPGIPSATIDSAPPQAPVGLSSGLNASYQPVLRWSPNSESDLGSYQVYQYSPDPTRDNAYVLVGTVSANTTEWAFSVPAEPVTHWMKVRAVDQDGNRSAESAAHEIALMPRSGGESPTDDEHPRRR